ncbi:MAG: DNA double-strand break repair nuclease NurA [Candidatus Odinarchaeota archaeon]|nr:DNA double-strand break repair nuclease NurA [Candidatus Odinarchaeota archaeon]
MWAFENMLNDIVSRIEALEREKRRIAHVIKDSIDELNIEKIPIQLREDLLEDRIIHSVTKADLKGISISAVDGGLLVKNLVGLDLIFTRATGVIFSYRHTGKVEVKYIQTKTPNIEVFHNFATNNLLELEFLAGLYRVREELSMAKMILNENIADILLLDGSIFPIVPLLNQLTNTFNTKIFKEVITEYVKLLDTADATNTILAGVIKDSRKITFISWLLKTVPLFLTTSKKLQGILESDYRRTLQQTNDSEFLYLLLNPGERTVFMKYHLELDNGSNILDVKRKNSFGVFYIKTVKYDHPLRVEFYDPSMEFVRIGEKLASVVYTSASFHQRFGLPSVLVEADNRARLSQQDIDFLYRQILIKAGINSISLMERKRDRKIF